MAPLLQYCLLPHQPHLVNFSLPVAVAPTSPLNTISTLCDRTDCSSAKSAHSGGARGGIQTGAYGTTSAGGDRRHGQAAGCHKEQLGRSLWSLYGLLHRACNATSACAFGGLEDAAVAFGSGFGSSNNIGGSWTDFGSSKGLRRSRCSPTTRGLLHPSTHLKHRPQLLRLEVQRVCDDHPNQQRRQVVGLVFTSSTLGLVGWVGHKAFFP